MIFTMPTSSAAAERSWSIHKYIHSKLRNRLLPETVLKLVFVYSNRMESDGIPAVVNDQDTLPDLSEEKDSEGEDQGIHMVIGDQCFDYEGAQQA